MGLIDKVLLVPILSLVLCILWYRYKGWKCRRKRRSNAVVIAFYHPFCSGGGGGERVLWKMIQVLGQFLEQQQQGSLEVVIYTIDDPSQSYKEGTIS